MANSHTSLGPTSAPGCMSRHRGTNTAADMNFGRYQPVIPGSIFIVTARPSIQNHWSIWSAAPAELSFLAVKRAYAIARPHDIQPFSPPSCSLRYLWEETPPQSTTIPPALSVIPIEGTQTPEHQTLQGGISWRLHHILATRFQSLPPILHM